MEITLREKIRYFSFSKFFDNNYLIDLKVKSYEKLGIFIDSKQYLKTGCIDEYCENFFEFFSSSFNVLQIEL